MTVLWSYLTYSNTSKYGAVSQNATGPGWKPPVSASTGIMTETTHITFR